MPTEEDLDWGFGQFPIMAEDAQLEVKMKGSRFARPAVTTYYMNDRLESIFPWKCYNNDTTGAIAWCLYEDEFPFIERLCIDLSRRVMSLQQRHAKASKKDKEDLKRRWNNARYRLGFARKARKAWRLKQEEAESRGETLQYRRPAIEALREARRIHEELKRANNKHLRGPPR